MYGRIEKEIAKFLERYPKLKHSIKYLYQRACYALFRVKIKTFNNLELLHSETIYKVLKNNMLRFNAFFGYYDKSPWSFDGKYYLIHIWDERERDKVKIGVYNLEMEELNIVGESYAFNFQQGSMLQWLGQGKYYAVFNATEDKSLVSKIIDIEKGKVLRIIPMPIQCVNKKGTEALTLNYKRLDKIRPEYGYKVEVDNFSEDMPYDKDGIWRINLETGKYEMIITLADLISNRHNKTMDKAQHKINHIVFSPSGRRFVFMHRWVGPYGKFSRLYTADIDGKNLYLLADDRMVSHYSWLDDENILAYARKNPIGDKYFLFRDQSDKFEIIGDGVLDIYGDGHPSYSPDKRWIITDTYPDKARMRYLILFDTINNHAILLGKFFSPWKYDGYYRCDLHPRWSPDGLKISIDSTHEGYRNSYIIDISEIVKESKVL